MMKSLAQARLKRVRAVELLAEGYTYDEIAEHLGFSHRGSAHRAVMKALAEREIESVDELRALELERLDALHRAHWAAALEGDVEAAQILLKISGERRRWYGIEKPQAKHASGLYGGGVLVQPWLKSNRGVATDSRDLT